MTDHTNWDTQPKAGWSEFQKARARFLARLRPGLLDTPVRTASSYVDGLACGGLPVDDGRGESAAGGEQSNPLGLDTPHAPERDH